MRNYIVDLDKLYQDELKKNADKKISKDFSIYVYGYANNGLPVEARMKTADPLELELQAVVC